MGQNRSRPDGRPGDGCAAFGSCPRWLALCALCIFIVLSALGGQALAQEPTVQAPSAVLIEAHTGRVLFEKNAHEPRAPASVTKVFTLVMALEALRDGRIALDDQVTTSRRAAGMGGTQVFLDVGEQMSLEHMLYGIAVESGNDAAVAVAEHVSGTEEGFAQLINERSRELGALNTEFSNASGLPPDDIGMAGSAHVTSAYDVALISRYGYTLPMFEQLVSTYGPYRVRIGSGDEREFWNRNRLLLFYEGANGIKTGFTQEARYCLAASAERNHLHLIAVVMGGATVAERDDDIRTMLNWGFSRYEAQTVIEEGAEIALPKVPKGVTDTARVVAKDDFHVVVPRGGETDVEMRLDVPKQLQAPLRAGQHVGELVLLVDGTEVGRVDAVAEGDVARGSVWLIFLRTARRLLSSFLAESVFRAGV